ncbi:unnamed protein product [Adineta ricciae]|uniref:Uncharacterized protein n=1 Tax=Adineta ricciae TaxID=249248 RepID=A0A813QMY9_ADIRI|nr:unnamed protein product [Adineta ricciae]CAF1381555.1 unnamed protein product [Adineta ricciae]
MATAKNKSRCFTCNKDRITYSCQGCSSQFCLTHLNEHQQNLNEQLNIIITDCDQFRERINQKQPDLSLIEEIDRWETKSIALIRQTAHQCRQALVEETQNTIKQIEENFNKLMKEIKIIQQENEFNEINLKGLKKKLKEINNVFNYAFEYTVEEENSQTFVKKISIKIPKKMISKKWKQAATCVAGGNGFGDKLNQFSFPQGIFIDRNQNIFIVDCLNHRIMRWKPNATQGEIVTNANNANRLSYPRDVIFDERDQSLIISDLMNRRVIRWWNESQQEILIDDVSCHGLAMDKDGYLYVSDWKKHEVRKWKMGEGKLVAGGNGRGCRSNQLKSPTFIFVDDEQSIYVSDYENHRVMKWRKDAEEGIVIAGGHGQGNNLNQLCHPEGVIVDKCGQVYIADNGNDRIMRWCEHDDEGEVIVGGKGRGKGSNQLSYPTGLSFDAEGNLYIVDFGNVRIQKFDLVC